VARWQRAQQEMLGGRHGPALASYRDLVQRFPGVVQLWFELGMAAAGQLDFKLAEQAFERAAELAGNDAASLVLIGQQFHRLRRLDRTRSCFERAAAADPSSLHAQLSLAGWYERERRLDDAWEWVEKCLAAHPQDPQALCLKALLLHRNGRNTDAETLLRDLLKRDSVDANVKSSSRHLLATVLDEMEQYSEAIHWLLEAKAQLRTTANVAKMEQDYDRADRRRRELLAALKPETVRQWRQQVPQPVQKLALLGGHPRSGTTLLEQILGAHPEIVAFDESEAFVQEVSEQLVPMQSTNRLTPEALSSLPPSRAGDLRRRYFSSLRRELQGEPGSRLLLDKNPSPTASLHLWLRLFPHSRILVALRDPRDVVLSCFFQNLMLTSTNANFLSFDRAVKHYADLMDVWLRMRELGGFEWAETRYEDFVGDLESEGRRVTEFLGLLWHPNQANHRDVTRNKIVFSPTYSDVGKPVHRRSVGRWQHYAEALAPIQERLAPYCRVFKYA
jgi:tetratricopeptide (TPR) repeat protein